MLFMLRVSPNFQIGAGARPLSFDFIEGLSPVHRQVVELFSIFPAHFAIAGLRVLVGAVRLGLLNFGLRLRMPHPRPFLLRPLLGSSRGDGGRRTREQPLDRLLGLVARKALERFYPARPPAMIMGCLLYTSPSPRDRQKSRMPSSA